MKNRLVAWVFAACCLAFLIGGEKLGPIASEHARAVIFPVVGGQFRASPHAPPDLQSLPIEELEKLRAQNPRDATILAATLARHPVFFLHSTRGPLQSPQIAWSVADGQPIENPLAGNPLSDGPPVDPAPAPNFAQFLQWARLGQQLEPQNAHFDALEMLGLCKANRFEEIAPILRRAARKIEFSEHSDVHLRRAIESYRREGRISEPTAKTLAYSALQLPFESRQRELARSIAQIVMGLRLQKRDAQALAVGMDALRLFRLKRLRSQTSLSSQVACACEAIILTSTRVPLGGRRTTRLTNAVAVLASDPRSLLWLANSQKRPDLAAQISLEWKRISAWRVAGATDFFGGLVERSVYENIGWSQKAARYFAFCLPVTAILWVLSGWIGFAKRIKVETHRFLPIWGAMWGCGIVFGALATELVARTNALAAFVPGTFCGAGFVSPMEILLVGWNDFSGVPRVILGAIPLVFLLLALVCTKPQAQSKKKIAFPLFWWRDDDSKATDSIGWLWQSVKRLGLWILQIAFWISPACLLVWPESAEPSEVWWFWIQPEKPLESWIGFWAREIGLLSLIFLVSPALILKIRGVQQRLKGCAPGISTAHFAAFFHRLSGGFLVAVCVYFLLAVSFQATWTQVFNDQFAPIENGKMVAAMQLARGVALR